MNPHDRSHQGLGLARLPFRHPGKLERLGGVEPPSSPWQGDAVPLSHSRKLGPGRRNRTAVSCLEGRRPAVERHPAVTYSPLLASTDQKRDSSTMVDPRRVERRSPRLQRGATTAPARGPNFGVRAGICTRSCRATTCRATRYTTPTTGGSDEIRTRALLRDRQVCWATTLRPRETG